MCDRVLKLLNVLIKKKKKEPKGFPTTMGYISSSRRLVQSRLRTQTHNERHADVTFTRLSLFNGLEIIRKMPMCSLAQADII